METSPPAADLDTSPPLRDGRDAERPDGAELLRRFLMPGPAPRLRRRDAALLSDARDPEVWFEGRRLAAYEWGNPARRPVVLAHGWASCTAHLAAFVEALLAAQRRVVAVDMPGHGASPGELSDLYRFRLTLHAVAERVGEFDAVIAHSGGVLATVMALREGLPTARVAALAPMARLKTVARQHGPLHGASAGAQADFMARMVERYGPGVWARTDGVAAAAELDVPALLLHDPDDDETPYAEAEELAAAWPAAHLRPVAGLGHRRILRHPQSVEAVLGFLG